MGLVVMADNVARKNLTGKQRSALEALFTYATVTEAAAAVGISSRQIYRWMGEPAFQESLRELERLALEAFSRRLVGMAEKAADAIEAGLDADNANTKLRAADIFTSRLFQLREMIDIEARLAALETAANDN